jgi:hypothetical protein
MIQDDICDTVKGPSKIVRYNELLHALTNDREGGENIPKGDWFIPVPQNRDWVLLQSSLFLNRRKSDYYKFLALTILHAHDDVLSLYKNQNLNVDLKKLYYIKSNFLDGNFTSVGKKVGGFKNYSDVFPIPEEYSIAYKNDKQLVVTSDVGRRYVCDCTVSERKGNSILLVDWQKKLPMEGPLICEGLWGETKSIDINYTPFGINYEQWIYYIESKMSVLPILNKTNLFAEYSTAESCSKKLALLIVSLALLNTSLKYSDG